MAEEGQIDWVAVETAAREGRLLKYLLDTVPRAKWDARNADFFTLLHYACWGDDNEAAVVALLPVADANSTNNIESWNVAHMAAYNRRARVLELLCAWGADVTCADIDGERPLDLALGRNSAPCVRVLVANGVRLHTASLLRVTKIEPWAAALERGVLRCRAAVVVLLGLKRRRGDVMWALDRWVVRELCFAIWSTRTNVQWSL